MNLKKRSIKVFEFTVYQTGLPSDKSKVLKMLNDILEDKIDVITFTSSSTVQNFFQIAQENQLENSVCKTLNDRVVVASIGPVTQKTLEEFNVNVDVVPNIYTVEQMMAALDEYSNRDPLCPEKLDLEDRKLLQILQDHFPLSAHPWKKIGDMLSLSEDEVMERTRKLVEQGTIHHIGPILDTQKIQRSVSTLVGLKVPKEKVERFPGLSINTAMSLTITSAKTSTMFGSH